MLHNSFGSESIDADAEFPWKLDKFIPVQATFRINFEDERRWHLYIASDRFLHSNIDDRCDEIVRMGNVTPTPFLDPVQEKPIPMDDRLAHGAICFHQRHPGRPGSRLGSGTFGGREIEGVYVYPSPIAAPVG